MINRNKIKKFLFFFALFLISLLPLFSFKKGLIIAGGDSAEFINLGNDFLNYFHSWSDKYNFGTTTSPYMCWLFPASFFFFILQNLHLPYYTIEILWFVALYGFGVVGYYYLVKEIYGKFLKHYKTIAGIGAFLYFFNVFISVMRLPKLELNLVQAALPLTLFLWLRGLKSNQPLQYSILFGLSTLLYASAFTNLPTVAPIFLTLTVISLYYLFVTKKIKKILIFISLSLIMFVLFNAWWMFDYVNNLSGMVYDFQRSALTFTPLGSGGIADVFRFLRSWSFISGYYYYADLYYQSPILFFTYFIPILALLSFIIAPKLRKINLFWLILLIVGMFLAKGRDAPFGSIYVWLFKNFPGFSAFREPYAKFTLVNVLAISVLFGCSIAGLLAKVNIQIKNKHREILYHIAIISFGLLIIINTAPQILIGGNVYESHRVSIPQYVRDTQKWFQDNPDRNDARIFLTPKIKYGHYYYWPEGDFNAASWPALSYFTQNPLFYYTYPDRLDKEVYISEFYDLLNDQNNSLGKTLGYFNTKYILQANDLDIIRNVYTTRNPSEIKKMLTTQDDITFKKSFGKWDIYEINNKKILPPVFISEEIFKEGIFTPALIHGLDFTKDNPPVFIPQKSDIAGNELKKYFCEMEQPFFNYSNACKINIPEKGKYAVLASFKQDNRINSHLTLSDQTGNINFRIKIIYEPQKVSESEGGTLKQYIYLGDATLQKEEYKIKFTLDDLRPATNQNLPELKNKMELTLVKMEKLKSNSSLLPHVNFQKTGRSKYLVNIQGAQQPFILVLEQSFQNGWKAKILQQNKDKIIPEHLIVNGFENGWYLDKKGDFKVQIYYWPEKILFAGQIVSLLALVLSGAYFWKKYVKFS